MPRSLFFCFVVLLLALPVGAQEFASVREGTSNEIAYIEDGNPRHELDLYLPEGDAPAPVIFMVHGGGYIFGDKSQVRWTARHFIAQGYAVVAPNYRLAPTHTYPAQIEDVFCALAWTVANAEQYNLDTSRLFLMGESAGANAIAMLAAVDDPQNYLSNCLHALPDDFKAVGVVAFYTPVDLSSCECRVAKRMLTLYLGAEADFSSLLAREDEMRDVWASASPLTWLDGSEAPFLLIHGTADNLVPISESELLQQRLQAVGVPVELFRVDNAGHGFFSYTNTAHMQAALPVVGRFLAQHD